MTDSQLATILLDRLRVLGRIHEKLLKLMQEDLFDSLNKHNPYWHDENEATSEKLHDVRCKVCMINDQIHEIWALLEEELDD
jgi:hypothetical protein